MSLGQVLVFAKYCANERFAALLCWSVKNPPSLTPYPIDLPAADAGCSASGSAFFSAAFWAAPLADAIAAIRAKARLRAGNFQRSMRVLLLLVQEKSLARPRHRL